MVSCCSRLQALAPGLSARYSPNVRLSGKEHLDILLGGLEGGREAGGGGHFKLKEKLAAVDGGEKGISSCDSC